MYEESSSTGVWLKMAMTHDKAHLCYMYRSITEIEKFTCCPNYHLVDIGRAHSQRRLLLLFCTFPKLNHCQWRFGMLFWILLVILRCDRTSRSVISDKWQIPSFTNENFMFCHKRCCCRIVGFNKFEYESTKFWLQSINLHLINSSFERSALHFGSHWNEDSLDENFQKVQKTISLWVEPWFMESFIKVEKHKFSYSEVLILTCFCMQIFPWNGLKFWSTIYF